MTKLSLDHRRTGRTTRQILALPQKAIFIVHSDMMKRYTEDLCRKLERTDIQVRSIEWFRQQRWRGQEFSGVDIDHHTRMTAMNVMDYDLYDRYFKPRIRNHE